MTESTAAKVDLVLLTIRWNQLKGNLPEGPVSTNAMAEVSEALGIPVGATTFRRIQDSGYRKLKLAALAREALQAQKSKEQAS